MDIVRTLIRYHYALCLLALSITTIQPGLDAQIPAGSRPTDRITSPVSDTPRIPLSGNVYPLAQARNDIGAAALGAQSGRLMLILKRSPEQQNRLDTFLSEVQDPESPNYHRFITPEEFGRLYGPSNNDVAAITSWLQGHGLTVAGVNKGRTAIEFSGTIGQLQQTFQTSIHRFSIGGTEHLANVSDPEIPAAFAQVVGGVASLNDFKPRANVVKGPLARWNPALNRFTPELTVGSSSGQYLFVSPGDAATIYNTPNSLNTRLASGQTSYDGTGVTIGIAGTTPLDSTGYYNYRNLFGLSQSGSVTTVYDGTLGNIYNSEDQTEAILDVEIASALAPGAHVFYYAAEDTAFQAGLLLAIYRAIDDNNVGILSVSYGACEAALGTAGNLEVLNAWEQAAAQGIAVVVSTGDSGAAGCDNQNLVSAATFGFGVNGLASTPYNIAVGGTDFDILSNSFATYVGSNSSNYTSARSYIPENPWNDSTSVNGSLSSNIPLKNSSGQTNIWAAGGGASSAVNGQSGYPKPAWQQGFSPSNTDSVRDIPDVSLFSATGHYRAAWALCLSTDCNAGPNSTIHAVGGTSASTPAFAGMLALINQKVGASNRLGQANWILYKLAQTAPSVFHGITTGNISVYCNVGTPNCGSNRFLTGYNASNKFSLANGLGSVDATLLLNHWADVSRASTSTSLSLDKTAFVHGTPVQISASVSPNPASGDIAITTDFSAQQFANARSSTTFFPMNASTASGTFTQFPGGTYNVYASFSGDDTYAGSISQPTQVKVTPEDSSLQLAIYYQDSTGHLINASGATIPLGTLISMNAITIGVSQSGSANPVTNASGTVTFSGGVASSNWSWNQQIAIDSSGTAELNKTNLVAGTNIVQAVYSGDMSYHASSAGPISFSIAKAPTKIFVGTYDSSTIGQGVTISAYISAQIPFANSLLVGGAVTFTDTTNNTVLGTSYAYAECDASSATICSRAPLTINSTQLVAGVNDIVATYAGDNNFEGSGPSLPVSITCEASCWNQFGQRLGLASYHLSSGRISAGGTITADIGVTQTGGFAGDVTLTCSVAGKYSNDQHIPTCSFDPVQVTVGSEGVYSKLTISTTARTTSANPRVNRLFQFGWAGGISLATLLLAFRIRFNRRRYFVFFLILLLSLTGVAACGGNSSSSSGGGGSGSNVDSGTTPDTYTVSFRAVDVATGTVTAQNYFFFNVY